MASSPVIGFFGPPSSSINWCETDYAVSHFIAEFFNSLSNIPPIVFTLVALYFGSLKYIAELEKNKSMITTVQPRVILLGYLVPIVVFSGSFLFHSTLTYAGQLLDEIPMLYGVNYFHLALSYHTAQRVPFTFLFTGIAVFCTYLMIALRESPVPFQVCYTGLVVALIYRCFLVYNELKDIRESQLLLRGVYLYGIAAVCWLLDVHVCQVYQPIEYLYLHAWWHLLAGTATYYLLQFLCAYNLIVERKEKFRVGKMLQFLPFVVPVSLSKGVIRESILINVGVNPDAATNRE